MNARRPRTAERRYRTVGERIASGWSRWRWTLLHALSAQAVWASFVLIARGIWGSDENRYELAALGVLVLPVAYYAFNELSKKLREPEEACQRRRDELMARARAARSNSADATSRHE